VYTLSRLWRLMSYTGDKPFTGDARSDDPKHGSAAYVAPIHVENFDHNIVYEHRTDFMIGQLADIRRHFNGAATKTTPAWHFVSDRQHWVVRDATDQGLPLKGEWRIKFGARLPRLESPTQSWRAEGALAVTVRGGAERPDRVHVDHVDDAFYASQKEPEGQKKLTVRNGEGKGLSFLITWSKTEPWKREGRERAGEAPGSPNPPTNGYHAVGVDVRPLAAKPRGTVEVWEWPSEGGSRLRVTVRH